MLITRKDKDEYIADVYEEMRKRGLSDSEIPIVIGKTGFMEALEEYPAQQLHYDVRDAVDEILVTAAAR